VTVTFEWPGYPIPFTTPICEASICNNTGYSSPTAAELSERRKLVVAEARQVARSTSEYVLIPSGMRVSPDIARTGYAVDLGACVVAIEF
jgi:hypothetical protein